jgi:hypothetical protein
MIGLDPAGPLDVDILRQAFHGATPTSPVPVFHLAADLDARDDSTEAATTISASITSVHDQLRTRFPLLDDRHWLVLRSGPQIGEAELALLRSAPSAPLSGALVISSATAASLEHEDIEVDSQLADVLHILAMSSLGSTLSGTRHRTWAIGAASVWLRPGRHRPAAEEVLFAEIDRLAADRPRDPGYDEGRRWIFDKALAPSPDGSIDAEGSLLRTGGAAGSLMAVPGRTIRQLDAVLELVDPGLWAGRISATIDAGSSTARDSPMAVALEQVDINVAERESELREQLSAAARAFFEAHRNLPTATRWCDGAAAALAEGVSDLEHVRQAAERIDLYEAHERLRKRARWLPYSSSTLVRACLVVILALVVTYAWAPIPTAVAELFSKRLPWVGTDLTSNARFWARTTAVGAGCLIWLWWEAKWRRVRRLRHRYIEAADTELRAIAEDHLLDRRAGLLHSLVQHIRDGSTGLRHWLDAAAAAIGELVAEDEAISDSDSLANPWAVCLPFATESARLASLSVEQEDLVRDLAIRAIVHAPVAGTSDEIVAHVRERLRPIAGSGQLTLPERWEAIGHLEEASQAALTADMLPGVDPSLRQHPDAVPTRYLLGTRETLAVLDQRLGHRPLVAALEVPDTCFAANISVLPLFLPTAPDAGAA